MKKTSFKIISLLAKLAIAMSFVTMFAACGHEHTFETGWTNDASNHWHAATCEHKDEVSDKAAHTLSDGVCAVCGYKAPHEHTFATAWTYDETNHWHAATCEHTTEVSGKAAHTLTDGACGVCDYKQEAKCKCEDACIICPECGGCIDTDCTNTECIKCGDGLKSNYFEAEEAELVDGKLKFNVSNKNIPESEEQVTYLQGVMGNTNGTITFKITSDKATTVTLRVRNGKNFVETVFTDNMMVTVNGDLIERESIVPAATPGGVHRKRDFDWTNLGCVNLVAGENTIVFIVSTMDDERCYNLDKIDVQAPAGTTLTWEPTDNTWREEI